MRRVIRVALYGPPNWLVDKFSSEDRRMFGFWTIVVSLALYPFFGRYVLFVSALSIIALIPNYASETPVEVEVDVNGEEETTETPPNHLSDPINPITVDLSLWRRLVRHLRRRP